MRRTNKILIGVMLVAIMLLGIGYAAIQNITLNIKGTAQADPSQSNFTVKFSGTPEVSDSSKVTATVTDDTNATIKVEGLTTVGETATATYTVQNTSTDLSADLSVAATNSNEEYFTISTELGKTSLVAGEATTLKVTVELIKVPITQSETSTIGIQLTATPVQPGEEGTTNNGGTIGDSETDIETEKWPHLKGTFSIAGENISLDAKHWAESIDFSDFDQTEGVWTDPSGFLLDSSATFQAPVAGIVNVTPEELLPVSTAGINCIDSNGKSRLVMYAGNKQNTTELHDVVEMAEHADSGYFAFDIFVLNTSISDGLDEMLLNATSSVTFDTIDTGIENAVRVGFALYTNTDDSTTANGILAQDTIISATVTDQTIDSVAIWEPNSDAHTHTILDTINPVIKFSSTDKNTWTGITTASASGFGTFGLTTQIPTYALTSTSVGTGKVYSNIYDWASPETGLTLQKTLQTISDFNGDDKVNLIDVSGGNLEMGANQYHRIRVYIWIESQDVDCNSNYYCEDINVDINLTKQSTMQSM